MKSKFINLALACSVILAAPAFAQTNLPTTVFSAVNGQARISAGAPGSVTVVGSNSTDAYVRMPITVSTAVIQQGSDRYRTNRPNVTTIQSFATYAFGNKEILQLTVGSNNVSGYSLVYTNAFDDAESYGLAAVRGTNPPLPVDPSDFSITFGNGVAANTFVENTNTGTVTSATANTFQGFEVSILNSIAASGIANTYVDYLRRHVFVNGSTRDTNTFTFFSTQPSGFSGLWQDDPILLNATNAVAAIANIPFALNVGGVNALNYGASGLPASLTIGGSTGRISGTIAGNTTSISTNVVSIRATNNVGTAVTNPLTIVVYPQAPVISSGATFNAQTNATSFFTNTTTLTNALTWAIFPTNLPLGVSFNPISGLITAATPAVGTNTFQISASNAAGVGTKIITIVVP